VYFALIFARSFIRYLAKTLPNLARANRPNASLETESSEGRRGSNMVRFTIAICTWWIGMTGVAAAQLPPGIAAGGEEKSPPVKTVAAPGKSSDEILPPLPVAAPMPPAPLAVSTASPGEAQISREARAHEQYLLQSQAQAESVHRAAMARFEQRTRRLESQRWFGISNSRPTANVDPYDGDYSPGWVSNYLFYPYRWVGGGEPWGFVEGQ
jgi:hypothetical protein